MNKHTESRRNIEGSVFINVALVLIVLGLLVVIAVQGFDLWSYLGHS